LDADGDGYSDGTSTTDCLRPTDYFLASELTATSGDCNDNDSTINPGASEVCDGVDNNCNMQIDEGVQNTYYADNDMDGFGDPNNTVLACELPAGFVTDDSDCDDNNASVNPEATEICNGIDDNCDGLIDTEDPALESEWIYSFITNYSSPTGSASFDPCDISGGPVELSYQSVTGSPVQDNVGFLHRTLCGDGSIAFSVDDVSAGTYVGVSFRESTDPGSKQVSLFSNGSNILLLQTRMTTNGPVSNNLLSRPFPSAVKLERTGNFIKAYWSFDGMNWQYLAGVSISMNNCIEAGIAIWPQFGSGNSATVSQVNYAPANYSSLQASTSSHSTAAVKAEPRLFPNPVQDELYVAFPENSQPTRMVLIGIDGKPLRQIPLDGSDHTTQATLPVEALLPGMYWLRVEYERQAPVTLPFIKQ
jgi:hypothetical protein